MSQTDHPPQGLNPLSTWVGRHAGIRVPDHDAAITWYREKLGFEPRQSLSHGATTFAFLMPASGEGCAIELIANGNGASRPAYRDLPESHNLMGWHHLCFHCTDVSASVEELKRRGVTIVCEPFDVAPLGIRITFFSDPWGNLFELLQPTGA